MNDIIDIHTHTVASGHAYNTLCEMASSAAEKGVRVFGCSNHAPNMPKGCDAFCFVNFRVISRDLYGPHLLMGSELSIIDYEGHVDLSPFYLEKLDYIIANLHELCYDSDTVAQNTAACLGAIENPHINIIGHSDDDRSPYDYDTIVAAAKEHHTLPEIDSSSLHPKNPRPGVRRNYERMLELRRQYQVPIIIDNDTHISSSVRDHRLARAMLEGPAFPEELIVSTSTEKLIPYIPVPGTYISGK